MLLENLQRLEYIFLAFPVIKVLDDVIQTDLKLYMSSYFHTVGAIEKGHGIQGIA